MPAILVLYAAYGTTSLGKAAQYSGQIDGLKPALATGDPIKPRDMNVGGENAVERPLTWA
ncbi:MAG TPA: hypothetical protein VMV04_22000 [Thermodesulfobacteriota bacterium]|jgi:hypothetical protein|nr:hypothetical protein [Thermodesulfobacteriota bacterium]